ncbi:MAG: UPF0182 family protein [Bacillota bacterium]|nr:UPF0182 family protein [Bacillota bacterium]
MKKKGVAFGFIFVILCLLVFLDRIVNFIVNVEWYKEVGYLSVYFTKLTATIKLFVPIFLVVYIAIWLYYKSVRKSIVKWRKVIEVNGRRDKLERKIFIIANLCISFLISYGIASSYWYMILQFANSTSFNLKDPIFNMDVSFYVFKLPLMESIYGLVLSLLVFLIILTLVIFFILSANDRFGKGGITSPLETAASMKSGITKFAGRQLAVVSSLIMLTLSFGYLIKAWDLVYSPRGVVFGASYTDVHVTLLFYRILTVVCLIASIVVFISVLSSKVKPIVASVILIFVIVISEGLVSGIVQNLVVKSNEKTFEAPYIKDNIDYTRKAFNVDNIDVKQFPAEDKLTAQDIASNRATIDNIKINSFKPALEFYNQVQVIRYYYNFNDIDVDRYNINGKFNQVFIAPREIDQSTLQGNADTWQNRHLAYTHGYGVVMSKVNSVTSEGQPDFVIKDIPPENSTNIPLSDPRIYFGEKTNDYVIVDTDAGEFDYPQGGQNKYNKYNGTAGISASLGNRILFAINQQDPKILLSGAINSQSKILINRNIVDRVQKIAPFLTYDKDPYIVTSNGKLYWIIDAYTTSAQYPFSQPEENVNYIRNSVKVIIDAVNGTTDFYIVDKNDPIAASYSKIFPGLFKDVNSVPQDLRQHFRYPEDLFNMQCNVLGKYHVTDPGVFYNGEDLWQVSGNQKQVNGDKDTNDSSYMVMKLPEESKEEMILLEYFNMRDKDNMVALFGARMDGENYGKMVLYKLPTQKTVYSPYLFKQKLNQDPVISKEISLWNTQGSQVQFGDTSIIPINKSLLYIEPLYLRAQGKNSIPEVKRVIVSFGEKMVIDDNIEDALAQIFSYTPNQINNQVQTPVVQTPADRNVNDKIKQAKDLYDKAIEAQKAGDWGKYGDYIQQLGKILEEVNK